MAAVPCGGRRPGPWQPPEHITRRRHPLERASLRSVKGRPPNLPRRPRRRRLQPPARATDRTRRVQVLRVHGGRLRRQRPGRPPPGPFGAAAVAHPGGLACAVDSDFTICRVNRVQVSESRESAAVAAAAAPRAGPRSPTSSATGSGAAEAFEGEVDLLLNTAACSSRRRLGPGARVSLSLLPRV